MIYFILAEEVNRVKIGFANKPGMRLSKLQTDSPCIVKPLAYIEGDVAAERELHERFASLRIRGEWFEYGPALRKYVKTLPAVPIKPRRPRSVTDMAEVVGIGKSYMSHILKGRKCPLPLMFHIFSATGWKHPAIASADDRTLRQLAAKLPWQNQLRKAA